MENNLLEIFQSILNINTDSVDVYSGEIQKYIKDAFTGFYIKELKDSMILSNKNIFEDNTIDMSNSLMIASHLDSLYYGQETKITEDGFIFGCGAVDDKPNLAVMIMLKDLILSLKSTIILSFTYDEECYVNGSKEVANYLSSINTNTLILWGEKDTDTPLKDGKLMHKKITNSELIIFPNCTHYCYLENTYVIIKIILCFLED